MLTKPAGLPDAQVAEALRVGWGLEPDGLEYAPLGFGSYHWHAVVGGTRWFVTADDLEARLRGAGEPPEAAFHRLDAALSTARVLRDAGLEFVVAPLLTRSGRVVQPVGTRFALAVYPDAEGEPHGWGAYPARDERLAVLELLVALHGAPPPLRDRACREDFVVAQRGELLAGLAALDAPWTGGPFSERARQALATQAGAVTNALDRYDALASVVGGQVGRMVLTHGEPHRGNTITTARGVVLIDWDTVLVAPPERDLWMLAGEEPAILDDYEARRGVEVDRTALDVYRLWWDLTEISIYVRQLRGPHTDDADTQTAWRALEHTLDPTRRDPL
jgi:spectinomycin phosphotransferase/16S rRNA (guanine(1405)-N(7))-methyltransferase